MSLKPKLILNSLLKVLSIFIFGSSFFAAESAHSQLRRSSVAKAKNDVVFSPYRKGVALDFSLFYTSVESVSKPSSASDSSSKYSNLDIKLGYINQAAFYWGIGYSLKTDEIQTLRTLGRGSAFGLGYFWSTGFDLRTYYRFHESYGDYSKGDGLQVNLTYSAKLTPMVNLGFNIDYREIKYLDLLNDSTFDSRLIKTIQPAVVLSVYF